MNHFLTFFETMPVWQKLLWVVLCIALFWVLEGYYQDVTKPYKKTKHARVNLSLLALVMIINVVFGVLASGVFV